MLFEPSSFILLYVLNLVHLEIFMNYNISLEGLYEAVQTPLIITRSSYLLCLLLIYFLLLHILLAIVSIVVVVVCGGIIIIIIMLLSLIVCGLLSHQLCSAPRRDISILCHQRLPHLLIFFNFNHVWWCCNFWCECQAIGYACASQ